jgi:hypothetical protein
MNVLTVVKERAKITGLHLTVGSFQQVRAIIAGAHVNVCGGNFGYRSVESHIKGTSCLEGQPSDGTGFVAGSLIALMTLICVFVVATAL